MLKIVYYRSMNLKEIETLIEENKTIIKTPRLDIFLNKNLEFRTNFANSDNNMILIVKNYQSSGKDLIFVYAEGQYSRGLLYLGKWD